MTNFKLKIQYNGTNYSGWQVQPNAVTIEKILTESIEKLLQEKINLTGAARTDAGVHALGQVANFHSSKLFLSSDNVFLWQNNKNFLRFLNCVLPKDISVKNIEAVDEEFHSRFKSKGKVYKYQIWKSPIHSPFYYPYSWHIWYKLDIESMKEAAKYLVGEKDFASFQGTGCDAKSTVRRIDLIEIKTNGELFEIWVKGSGFLKHMVRNMVGTLVKVGTGEISPHIMKDILNAKDRRTAGPTAPAKGLFLVEVKY
ncbi:MAG: tRNA pseudouridine(38-40) synthase TruA [Candidatus Schekmanbacteria bacterium RIFCSPHIGHO2_02_FULL_38_11]|uniref:tRNA pseudouridine synthase A n=1 Tax=Candidatus Schekmanbacteria bacterium RIFCSPLOWO2_12_FULL_38_15 TaxID=1817883 RepID=A0A1F7SI69_9BACT|nr:MAG: tRNA pseudouridine(38-40) synthase TruA [Candidatus Schekmanbacteria bacterium GWA2_38_9]OGL50775.1 MAG: tRNA pseudouridine(38-40) synthase TruA [Candidatus Schekmanbacteria bacterium RIFCSPLOWO2_02_FULL_38_14]OGL53465.1 MAG: tRNA pseudouridine(38-40) synthase TruA [Candidatus Schekmanbacteria bacterium RIFCSPLOWO2_12_FULL_38_15]OGL54961.1 MAG: tRNA pseudouridine(38-40) synthase TruA [Candidatus Schekmanbacteria bacterium RIFCSPHIGHO2_02_FULL_38_11]